MPGLEPFPGVRYAEAAGDPGDLLAPPYDVIDPEEARELRGRSPHNFVRLILPEAGEEGDPYRRAAERLRAWREEGVLERDEHPSLYAYAQSYEHGGEARTRRAIFGALPLSPFEEGEVLPHEETHREPKEDRLALSEACEAQLSPIFLLSPDPEARLDALVGRATEGRPALHASTPDGTGHRLWPVAEGPLTRELERAVAASPLLIADGHHRYETALELHRRRPDLEGAGLVLAAVVSTADPGLVTLPTHRALRRPPEGADGWPEALSGVFELEPVQGEPAGRGVPGADGAAPLTLVLPGGQSWRLSPRPEPLRRGFQPEATDAGVVLFDRLVLRELYGLDAESAVERGLLSYHRDPEEAVATAGDRGGAFLVPGLEVEQVWRLARTRGRLPPKSTYFWPKLPSGLVLRQL